MTTVHALFRSDSALWRVMGLRSARKMIFTWTETVGALRAAGADVVARCSRCDKSRPVDLVQIEQAKGSLYCLWNKSPPCPEPGCDDTIVFQASMPGAGVWPVHLRDAEAGQVAFLDARWRADRLNAATGHLVSLQLVVAMLRHMARYGMFQGDQRERLIAEAVAQLPPDSREDARWLINHYIEMAEPREGWR